MTSLADLPMYQYQYDNNGNIVAFLYANYDGTGAAVRETYKYDSLNQLVRTNSLLQNATWVYDYDDGGNILSKTKYEYTTESDLSGLTPVETINYTYGNENWGDLLTSYNGKAITYDAIGNPLAYDSWAYTWTDGRRLATASDGTTSLSYKYNADGIRTSKTVNGTTTEFFLNGSQIIAQKTGDDIMWFYYDHDGKRIGLEYQGAMYYYAYNLQGDVKYISDSDGNVCGGYYYDDWGKVTGVFNSGPNTVATANPFRYRGYYYDTETELYYLNSRYYNPEWGRFINADGIIGANGDVISTNLFAYCGNNPVNRTDTTGKSWFGVLVTCVAVVAVCAAVVAAAPVLATAAAGVGIFASATTIATTAFAVGTVATCVGVYAGGMTIAKSASKTKSTSRSEVAVKERTVSPPKSSTKIYRYGGTNPGNLTPKEKDLKDGSGLSFSTIPKPGAAETTIEELNATGIVYAVQDKATHVSVYPVGGTMEDWVNEGASSNWTQAVKSVVVKWDGVN